MLAPSKRRRLSYYLSLPLVVAILFGLVAKLAALQRADMIAELADRVAHRDTPEAAAAVRQLASMPRPPVAILVLAATSTDREVAEEAKQALDRLLRRVQRQIEAEQRVGTAAQQLSELAESLAKQQAMFSRADYPWVTRTTRKLLRLSNRIPPRQAPLVAMHCDAVLAAVTPKEAPATVIAVAANQGARNDAVAGESAAEVESWQARLGREFSAISTGPRESAVASDVTPIGERPVDGPAAESDAPIKPPWQATWSHPIFRMVPAMPIEPLPERDDSPKLDSDAPQEPAAPPRDTQPTAPPLAAVDVRELLARWLEAEGADVFPLEQELTRRGFGRLSERLAAPLFSPAAEDRLRLVDAVLTEPGVDARPWLVLLADDADADVRLLAVTIMATSNDVALVEKAWMVALHDRDPRIAGLAGRLRERRDDTLRR